jgi:hypothetical protein
MNVLRRTVPLSIAVLAAAGPSGAGAQAAPAEYFAICGSQQNLPTVYFSGVLHGPATAFAGLRTQFTEYLAQHYAYKGPVGCLPAANALIALNAINAQSAALRKAKKIVIETGWTEGAVPPVVGAAPAVTAAMKKAIAPATSGAGVPGAAGSAATGGKGGSSDLASFLNAVFGGSSGGGCPGSGAKPQAAAAGASGCQNSAAPESGAANGAAASASVSGPQSGSSQSGNAAAGLGSAQADSTKLVVYGCGRHDTQVACVSELTNQNQKNTLVQSGDVWKDAFIVDDRGDRHQRSSGFFVNIDGDQRAQLDISYGKTARFILKFDGVQTKVQKVALRSTTGGLDVEDIPLIPTDAGASTNQ